MQRVLKSGLVSALMLLLFACAGTATTYRNENITFDYPSGLQMLYNGPDTVAAGVSEDMRGMTLVSFTDQPCPDLKTCEPIYFILVRYVKFQTGYNTPIFIQRDLKALIQKGGGFYPSADWFKESSAAGQVETEYYPESTSYGRGQELWLSTITSDGNLAHVILLLAHVPAKGEAEAARRQILKTLHFNVVNTLTGSWRAQGPTFLRLNADHTFKEEVESVGYVNSGTYTLQNGQIVFRYQYFYSSPRQVTKVCTYRLEGDKLTITQDGSPIEYSR
jgi:hypothetical protein